MFRNITGILRFTIKTTEQHFKGALKPAHKIPLCVTDEQYRMLAINQYSWINYIMMYVY